MVTLFSIFLFNFGSLAFFSGVIKKSTIIKALSLRLIFERLLIRFFKKNDRLNSYWKNNFILLILLAII
jgi:hypothetical protein